MPNPELILTNVFGIFCIFITFSLGIFALVKAPKKGPNLSFFFMSIVLDIYYVSHLLGINAPDAVTSRRIFMFNLINFFIIFSSNQFTYETFGTKTAFRRGVMIAMYAIGAGLLVFFTLNPDVFMQLSVPKLYLPFYYERGSLYWMMTIYFMIFAAYNIFDLAKIYRTSTGIEKNRVKYIFAGITYGYALGTTALFLVYNIPFDPLYSLFFGLYTIPFAYAFLNYELLDIHVVAKRALIYSGAVVFVSLLIIVINTTSEYIAAAVPGLPFWLTPFLSACVATGIAGFILNKLQEVEKLKYTFITEVTHRFRQPLDAIQTSIDAISKSSDASLCAEAVETIRKADSELFELTDLLIGVKKTEKDQSFTSSQPVKQ